MKKSSRTAFSLSDLYKTEFVGRNTEYGRLRDCLAEAANGRGQLVLIAGEAGIGKTRLVREALSDAVTAFGAQWVEGDCVEYKTTVAYLPFREAFEQYFDIDGEDGEGTRSDKIKRVIYANLESVAGVIPVVGSFLSVGIQITKSAREEFGLGQSDPLNAREDLFYSLYQLIRAIARRGLFVIFLDDLHWADRSSLDLLHFLTRKIAEDRVLIIGAYRPEFLTESDDGQEAYLTDVMNRMTRESLFKTLSLDALTTEDIHQIVHGVLGESPFASQVGELVTDESEGNPYYAEETVKALLADGVLIRGKDRAWRIKDAAGQLEVPRSLKALVETRLMRIEEPARIELRNAAVIGEQFQYALLKCLSRLEEEQLVLYLDNLVHLDLIRELRSTGESTFEFTHKVLREVLYESPSEIWRRHRHRLVAACIETTYPARLDALAEDLARHYRKAGMDREALGYLEISARKARDLYAFDEALHYYSEAISILGEQEKAKKAELLLARGHILFWITKFGDAEQDFRAALALGMEAGNDSVIGICRLMLGQILSYWEADWDQSLPMVLSSLPSLERANETERLIEAHCWVGTSYENLGAWDEADASYQKALALANQSGSQSGVSLSLSYLGYLHYIRGEWQDALQCFRQALAILESLHQKLAIPDLCRWMSLVYSDMGDHTTAWEWADRDRRLREALGQTAMPATHLQLGVASLALGNLSEAQEHLQRSIAQAGEAEQLLADAYCEMGGLYARLGKFQDALDYCQRGTAIFERLKYPEMLGYGRQRLGDIYLAMGDGARAIECYQEVRAIAEKLGARKMLGDATRSLGQTFEARGQRELALSFYEQAFEVYRRTGDTRSLTEVEDGLRRLEKPC